MVLGNSLNHFLNQNGLAHACAAKETDLAALNVGGQQVDDLDAGLEHLGTSFELVEGRGLTVNGPTLGDLKLFPGLKVQNIAGHIEDVALGDITNRYRNRCTGIGDDCTANHAVGRLQGDRAHEVVAEVLCNLKGDGLVGFSLALPR